MAIAKLGMLLFVLNLLVGIFHVSAVAQENVHINTNRNADDTKRVFQSVENLDTGHNCRRNTPCPPSPKVVLAEHKTKNLAESAIDGRKPSLSADSNPLHNPH